MKGVDPISVASLLCCFVHVAQAQSSVTLYGVFDQGLLAVTNAGGGHVYQSSSGWLSGSRWGLKGSEDLGGGLRTIFVLEGGFDGSTGLSLQGGSEFGRQAYVGMSGPYGTLTAGRQYDMVVDHLGYEGMISEIWSGAFGCHPGDVDNLCNSRRMNNSVKYSSQRIGGFSFGAAYAFGGLPGAYARGSIWSAGGDYTLGAMSVGVGYFNVNGPNTAYYGASGIAGTSGAFSNGLGSSPVYSGFATANRQETLAAGTNYTIGSNTLGVTYSHTRFDNLGTYDVVNTPALTGTATLQNIELRYAIYITPFLLTGIAFHYTSVGAVGSLSGARYRQINLGVNYYVSKRTTLYAVFAGQSANGENSNGRPAVAALAFVSASSTSRQLGAQIGIRHLF
ncbi:putative porin [Paraburkholderia sp. RAU6.4a]|uniref:porin n=1 Tax=Paraburkholderia sp. RAU6.4a TaxID=2991067 RepID=UPI003D1CB5C2